jgi:hypothetical protein
MSWASRIAASAASPASVAAAGAIPQMLPSAAAAPAPAPSGAYVPPWKRVTFADQAAPAAAPEPPRAPRACEGATLQPIRLADLPAAPAAPKTTPGAYVPPSLRKAEEAAKPATLNIDDARAFPTFAAPGRPAPVAAAALPASALNFKKTIEERIVKDVEEAAALAKPKEEDPLKMTREELVAEGWTVLDRRPPGGRRELADRFHALLASQPPEDLDEDLDSMCPDGRSAIYDASFEPYKSPIVQQQEIIVAEVARRRKGPTPTELLLARYRAARSAREANRLAAAAAAGEADRVGSTDAEASAAALSRHLLLSH